MLEVDLMQDDDDAVFSGSETGEYLVIDETIAESPIKEIVDLVRQSETSNESSKVLLKPTQRNIVNEM